MLKPEIKIYAFNGDVATVEICESNGAGETITHNIRTPIWVRLIQSI
jgi:hypothetical protein